MLTSHQLARLLLQHPDLPCLINAWEDGNEKEVSNILVNNGFVVFLHEECNVEAKKPLKCHACHNINECKSNTKE